MSSSFILAAICLLWCSLHETQQTQTDRAPKIVTWKKGWRLDVLGDHYFIYYHGSYITCLTCQGNTFFTDVCGRGNRASVCCPCPPGSHQPLRHQMSHLQEFCKCNETHSFWDDSQTCVRCQDCPEGSHLVKSCSTQHRQFICCQDERKASERNKMCTTHVGLRPQVTADASSDSQNHRAREQKELGDEAAKESEHLVTGKFGYPVLTNPSKPENSGDDAVATSPKDARKPKKDVEVYTEAGEASKDAHKPKKDAEGNTEAKEPSKGASSTLTPKTVGTIVVVAIAFAWKRGWVGRAWGRMMMSLRGE